MKYNLYHSSSYNLRMILSPHLLYDEENYIKYIDYTFTPITERDKTSLYLKIDYNLSIISSYLIFNILNSLFVKQSIVKKDMEEYYNSEILNYINRFNKINEFQLKDLAINWTKIDNLINFYLNTIKDYKTIETNYSINWSDGLCNYYYEIPLIGLNNNSIDLYFIIQKDLEKLPISYKLDDIISIPSLVRTIGYFYNNNININKINIAYLDFSNYSTPIKLVDYPKIYFKNNSIIEFFKVNSDNKNYVNNPLLSYQNPSSYYLNLDNFKTTYTPFKNKT